MKVYTKTGDRGETSLADGQRVSKDELRVECYGTVDELNTVMGIAKNFMEDEKAIEDLQFIQNKLFSVAAMLAMRDKSKLKKKIEIEDVEHLESLIDEYMEKVGGFKGFIVPGNTKPSAFLHHARTVARRAERRIIALSKTEEVEDVVIKYINRISDLMFAMASLYEGEPKKVTYSR